MATQTQLPSPPEIQNQIQNHKSLLDEPWKVTLIPAAAPVSEDPHVANSLPWRVGDVTRLKDDSPKGMMEYIATHSSGWWQEMAQRALRDTEKAERMAREQGWEYGQYWALEVDAEAKQKLLDAEEARRAREETERAREEAEKEAFIQRQMELLKKAGRAPRCEYKYTDGRGCKAPQVRGERWCHGHAKMMSYRPEKLEMLPMEDEQAVMVNLYRVTNSLLSGRISEKVAGLTLWSIAIGAPGAGKLSPQRTRRAQRKNNTHRGGPNPSQPTKGCPGAPYTETRRKTRKDLPQMEADKHGSQEQLANGNWQSAKPRTFETQRNGGSRENKILPPMNADTRGSEKRLSRESTRKNTNHSGTPSQGCTTENGGKAGHSGTQPQPANTGPSGDPGVTNDKSFVSGEDRGSTPRIAEIAKARCSPRRRGDAEENNFGSEDQTQNL